ncbi:polyhydroxyalkanoate depolymerase [Hansschlegelia quercus]|uniref:Polyhydroxyalkanoate depolymerase n=1 Tax=Hansschlegelia quercus TaxID=2528245 RepID=A0A4Q9GDK0_9HYPH|nr:polyhydroxyalkanoate depolymerase [Hansschlegelia quercus]TBN48244.1 polyhydroxyalkanoate depolymerase [Hansschlegelia quercus]
MPRKKKAAGIGEFGGAPEVADWGGSLTSMPLYWMFEATQASLGPARALADAGKLYFKNPVNPASHTEWGRKVGAMCEVFERATRRYGKPEFGIESVLWRGERVAVSQEVVWRRPFCDLIRFNRALRPGVAKQPKLLIVAPMSGHYATLLRGTVEAMLPDHEVYITDWTDARLVPLSEGSFDLDDYIDYLISIFHFMRGECHVMAVCQPAVPVLAAVARMEAEGDPYSPRSMTLMGGPIDTRENPTAVNQVAIDRGTEWFQRNVVTMVPWPHPGAMRQVYPGFLQLTGFVSMNFDRHVSAHKEFFQHLVDGDGDGAEKHREFYDEYLAVMDLTAEFYLQTVDTVFVRQALPKGEMTHRGKPVDCSKIKSCALMTVEGERDDISGVGQTSAAHTLCTGLSDDKRVHYLQERVGHYGVFNGSRFRAEIAPRIRDFIRWNEPAAQKAPAPAKRPAESGGVSSAEETAAGPLVTGSATKTQVRAKPSAPKAAASKPSRKPAARGGKASAPADDLTRITGVGPKIQSQLNEAGIFHFWQIAKLSAAEIRALEERFSPPGRITRDKWVEQAERLTHAD